MSFFTRDQCLQRLRAQVAAGRPIIGGGAGIYPMSYFASNHVDSG